MTVALSDTKLLCDMLQPLPDFTDSIATANQTAEFYTKRKPLSATINTLANALYKVSISPVCLSVCLSVYMYVCNPQLLAGSVLPTRCALVNFHLSICLSVNCFATKELCICQPPCVCLSTC